SAEPRVVCYYTNWSVYRPGTARFNPQNINPYLCTHLVYAFGGFTKDNTFKPFDKYQDIEKGGYAKFTGLKTYNKNLKTMLAIGGWNEGSSRFSPMVASRDRRKEFVRNAIKVRFHSSNDSDTSGYAKFTGLKTYNKNLKTMLAIGGWNEGSSRFSPMVASRDRRKEFVRNAIKFLRQNHFDGLDLDWEYPAFRDGGKPKDRENYAKLVRELREEFERESEKTGKPRLLLTMAVPAGIEYIQKGFDIETLNKYLDWMNLLSYDYHSAFEPAVNHHAPLYPLEEPNEYSVDNELNIDYTIKFYLENGADPNKLVLGIPTYGRSYTLFNPDAVEIGSPADGPGEQGDATREKGYLAYYEICEALKPKQKKRSISSDSEEYSDEEEEEEEEWTVMHPNPTAMGPVAFKGNQWVGYDDIDIVKKKAEYVAENGLGGIMFWSIDNDDFRGNCHGKPYPLIEAAKESYIQKLGSTDNTVVSERPKSRKSGSKSGRRNKRPRTTSTTTTTTTTEKPSTRSNKRKSGSATSTTPAWNVITPEPPTTPDPGSDFKCTDEGFFPHPRDCKKYFWCLDSGPSDLGIVAHQFTCPSGLYFNKAADSCDFARNVLCKVSAATTKAPTKAPTTRTTVTTTTTTTTTRKPLRISTRNSLLFRTTSTTPAPQEEEYEDEDDEDNTADDAEDPKVIKELIDLIKKVGGVEQLEKQLGLSETSISTSGDVATSTPSSFNKKLYQKVLERARGRGKFNTNGVTGSQSQNSRSGPQNEGLQPTADQDRLLNKDRPQYVTINRSRPPTTENSLESEEIEEEQESAEQQLTRGRSAGVQSKVATTSKPLQYVNIRRSRPTTTVPDSADDSGSRNNALFERVEPYVSVSEAVNSLDIASARRENIPEYVTIRRSRPTTETTTAQYQNSETEVESQESALEREITSPSLQPQYTSVLRIRSTTLPPLEEPSSPEPTTVLAVQISSLLNSPTPAEIPSSESLSSISITTQEIEVPTTTATSPTTTTLPTTPSTTTTTEAPSTTTSRRNGLRRRGSTTASTATTSSPTSTTQVSSRNYNFVRRRKPLSTPNEITSESEENILSRKIRSTTPNSREVEGIKQNRESARNRRFRIRYQPSVDDSLPAAASPVSASNFEEKFNSDEDLSLTSADDAPMYVRRDTNNDDIDEETSSTEIDEIPEDSEFSATTVEDKRPTTIFRGRGRYTTITTTEAISQSTTTESAVTQRRPTFARFTPRPFARPTLRPSINRERTEGVISPRIPLRASFGRSRLSTSVPNIAIGPQPRRLPFPSRSTTTTTTTTTEQTFTTEIDDEDLENKRDDIYLSESAIEEKEHKDENERFSTTNFEEETERVANGRFSTTESYGLGETVTNDSGTRKFKVIRRRPTKTTVATETTPTPDFTDTTISTVPRIRKIIRKKIKPFEGDIETTTKYTTPDTFKEITKLALNYGEKTKSTTMTPTTTESQDVEDLPIEPKFESNKQQPKLKGNDSSQESQTKPAFDEEDTIVKNDKGDDSQNDQLTRTEEAETPVDDKTDGDSEVNSKDHKEDTDADTKEDQVLTEDSENDNMAKPNENNNTTVSDQDDNISDDVEITTFENKTDTLPEVVNTDNLKETDTISKNINNTKSENEESDINSESETNSENESNNLTNPTTVVENAEVVIESNDKGIDLSEKSESLEESLTQTNDTSETEPTTTTTTTTSPSSSVRTRLPYRPPKRLFTSTTESSLPSSSRTFSRKYNPGAYTSPATVEREPFRPSVTRRPLFSRTFTRKPFTARTTKRVEEDEYSDEELLEEEGIDEESENPFVFVPPSQLFTRKPDSEEEYEDEGNEEFEDGLEEEEIYDEEQITTPQTTTIGRFTTTSRRPLFRPRVVNSNTFRTSTTTTELPNTRTNATQVPKRTFNNGQNKTVVYNRFSSNKPVNDTKKRVQNVPIGYSAPKATPEVKNTTTPAKVEEKVTVTTVSPDTSDSELTTVQNEINTSSNETSSILVEGHNDETTNTFESQPTTDLIEVDTDEYLENSDVGVTQANPEDLVTHVQTESIPMTTERPTTLAITTLASDKESFTTDQVPDTTTIATPAPPIVKTQFNKLFSVSRVVEVSSKQDKHHLNKNNETTSIEEGPIVIEKKPTVDKIGEVSRFTLIKIVEDEIPIYLTKLGHVYPVDNPPNNPIRIDEARNARSLGNYNYPKESLLASESMNEAYRHIKEFSTQHKEPLLKREVEQISDDDFLSYINEDKKVETVEENQNYQFIPAAYENEQNRNSKNFDIVTPRIMRNNPSTLSLEGLFKTASPVTPNKNSDKIESQPFFVYSVADPTESTKNVEPTKPEINSTSSDKIQEPKVEQYTTMSPKHKTKSTEYIPSLTSDKNITASPIIDLLTTVQPISATESKNVTITPEPITTSAIQTTESSTLKSLLRNNKKSSFPFIRRPNIKISNLTRSVETPRTAKKISPTVKTNSIQKFNKTSTFTPSKSRFSANRAQNIPVDTRKRTTSSKFVPKITNFRE
ncbi:Acidic mammalian chitinase, partial [Papilio xuthus]